MQEEKAQTLRAPARGYTKYAAEKAEAEKAYDNDPVNHPNHYNRGRIEVIEFMEDQALDLHRANALKYLCRAGAKDDEILDLKKAVWYLSRKIELLTAERECRRPVRPNDMK